jgi:hypothetical protein
MFARISVVLLHKAVISMRTVPDVGVGHSIPRTKAVRKASMKTIAMR